MATFRRIQDIRVWHLARKLVKDVYYLSDSARFRKDGPLRNQIRRASVSIVSNIAEGFERDGNKEFMQFLSQAKGSAGEVLSQLYIALDQNYCEEESFHHLQRITIQTLRMLESLMKYLRESDFKGKKFVKYEIRRSSLAPFVQNGVQAERRSG